MIKKYNLLKIQLIKFIILFQNGANSIKKGFPNQESLFIIHFRQQNRLGKEW